MEILFLHQVCVNYVEKEEKWLYRLEIVTNEGDPNKFPVGRKISTKINKTFPCFLSK